jgi:hypothetical protein
MLWELYLGPYRSVNLFFDKNSSQHFWHLWNSSVGVATDYGPDDRMVGFRIPAGAGNFSLHRFQTGPGAHPASYPLGTRGSFPES